MVKTLIVELKGYELNIFNDIFNSSQHIRCLSQLPWMLVRDLKLELRDLKKDKIS